MYANKKTPIDIFLLVFIFSILILISSDLTMRPDQDDQYFKHALDNRSFFEFLSFRYLNWSGRYAIEALLLLTIPYSWFWKLMIPLCILLCSFSIWSLILRKSMSAIKGTSLCCGLIMIMSPSVANDSMWWITGAYNYLLPVTMGLYSIDILIRQKETATYQKFLSILALFIASSTEQPAICLIIGSLLFVTCSKTFTRFSFTYIFLCLLFSSALFLSPGNHIRYVIESYHYMPEIQSYSLFQKFSLGMDRVQAHLKDRTNFLLFSASFLCLFKAATKRDIFGIQDIIAIIVVSLFNAFFLVTNNPIDILHKYMAQIFTIEPNNWNEISIYTSWFFSLASITSMLWFCLEDNIESYICFAFFALSLLVTIAVGMSPTVYASEQRILFLFDISLVAFTCYMIKGMFNTKSSPL